MVLLAPAGQPCSACACPLALVALLVRLSPSSTFEHFVQFACPRPMTLLPPRLAIRLSAGISGALIPSHTFHALVLCVLLANSDIPSDVAVLFCQHASVLPCHRLPYRPSISGEAPLPRFCMPAFRPCAVFCKHDLPLKKKKKGFPCRPSSSQEAPLPRFCMLALWSCAVL